MDDRISCSGYLLGPAKRGAEFGFAETPGGYLLLAVMPQNAPTVVQPAKPGDIASDSVPVGIIHPEANSVGRARRELAAP